MRSPGALGVDRRRLPRRIQRCEDDLPPPATHTSGAATDFQMEATGHLFVDRCIPSTMHIFPSAAALVTSHTAGEGDEIIYTRQAAAQMSRRRGSSILVALGIWPTGWVGLAKTSRVALLCWSCITVCAHISPGRYVLPV